MTCPACGAALVPATRSCPGCGAAVGQSPRAAGWRAGLPWSVAGAALGALATLLALQAGGGAADVARHEVAVPVPRGSAPDISQMSPEERAGRLYDRVVALAERGQDDSVAFFLPMALGAYAQLPALALDARYDIGSLLLAGHDAAGALAQADTILRAVPTHLYGFMLRAQAFELRRDARRARQAYASFLRHEPAERARQRAEYAEHDGMLDAFHQQAVRQAGARSGA